MKNKPFRGIITDWQEIGVQGFRQIVGYCIYYCNERGYPGEPKAGSCNAISTSHVTNLKRLKVGYAVATTLNSTYLLVNEIVQEKSSEVL